VRRTLAPPKVVYQVVLHFLSQRIRSCLHIADLRKRSVVVVVVVFVCSERLWCWWLSGVVCGCVVVVVGCVVVMVCVVVVVMVCVVVDCDGVCGCGSDGVCGCVLVVEVVV
jgi:hypothetical protein